MSPVFWGCMPIIFTYLEVPMALKMRVLYLSNKGKLRSIAEQLSKENDIKVDTIPPAYNVEKERLLIVAITLGSTLTETARRFFAGLDAKRAANVALIVDGTPENAQMLIDIIKDAGANVMDDVLYVKGGLPFFSKATQADLDTASEWSKKIIASIK